MTTEDLRRLIARALLEAKHELRGPTDMATPTDILDAVDNAFTVILDHIDPEGTEK